MDRDLSLAICVQIVLLFVVGIFCFILIPFFGVVWTSILIDKLTETSPRNPRNHYTFPSVSVRFHAVYPAMSAVTSMFEGLGPTLGLQPHALCLSRSLSKTNSAERSKSKFWTCVPELVEVDPTTFLLTRKEVQPKKSLDSPPSHLPTLHPYSLAFAAPLICTSSNTHL